MRCSTNEEREFYLRLSVKENYSYRELERQISASYYERTMLMQSKNQKLSAVMRVLPDDIQNIFKEQYVLDFFEY